MIKLTQLIKMLRELHADTVVFLAFLCLFTVVVSVQIVETRLMNAVLVSNVVSYPWTTPVLNKEAITAYDCVRIYYQPPSWVCNWSGERGDMQTHVYIAPNTDIDYPNHADWANENNILPDLQTEK
jgi:hypothetical protein